MTEEDIRAKIADGTIFGISIDTAVFDKYGCNLDFAVLNKLDQFKSSPTQVLISEIVANEIKSHITREAEESKRQLTKRTTSQQSEVRWCRPAAPPTCRLSCSADTLLPRPRSSAASGKNMNFQTHLHFSLWRLSPRAREKLLLCVSPDFGWKNFAAQSEHLVCVADLELTLSYFNDVGGRIVADRTMDLWKRGAAPRLAAEVEHAFEYRLEDVDFEADASSPLEYESEPNSAVVQYVKPETASAPVVIAAGRGRSEDDIHYQAHGHRLVRCRIHFLRNGLCW
jgi:hypothetical protein